MSTRDRILDAAAEVMTERGIAATTTRAIAAAAGLLGGAALQALRTTSSRSSSPCSSSVMPTIALPGDGAATGRHGSPTRLTHLVRAHVRPLPAARFPMAVSIFGSPELLAEHRDSVRSRGFGPEGAVPMAAAQLAREQATGRIRKGADVEAAASLLVGFAFHQAFLAVFDGREKMPSDALPAAVAVALPYLEPGVEDA